MRRVVWSFWEGPDNEAITDALVSWRAFLPGWSIRRLNIDTFRALDLGDLRIPSTFDQLTPTTKSDVVRLALLCRFGGLWMDASIILKRGLDWLRLPADELLAFKLSNRKYLENWLLWCPAPHHPQMLKWQRAFNEILEYHPDYPRAPAYREAVDRVDDPGYFMCYQAFLHLLKVDPDFASWGAAVAAKAPDAYPHFQLTDRRLVKLTRFTRRMYNRRRSYSAIVVGALGGTVLVLMAAWIAVDFPLRRLKSSTARRAIYSGGLKT